MSSNEDRPRDVVTVQTDGRMTVPDNIRRYTETEGKKWFCQVEAYNKDKIVLTVLSRWKK